MERIVAFVGDNSVIGNGFGKQGTKTDMTLYNGPGITAVVPHAYPEKLTPLLQAIELSDFVVFAQEKIDWTFGEILLALDTAKRPGVFFHKGYDAEKIRALSKGYACENYKFVSDIEELKKIIGETAPAERNMTILDEFFEVRGVGLVALGVLKGGEVKAYDRKTIYPQEKEVMIKSIQVHDETLQSVSGFSRVGYALKDIDITELERGTIIPSRPVEVRSNFPAIDYNRFSKPLEEGESAMVCFGAQERTLKVKGGVKLNKPAAVYCDGVVFRNDFNNKLRIIGRIPFRTA